MKFRRENVPVLLFMIFGVAYLTTTFLTSFLRALNVSMDVVKCCHVFSTLEWGLWGTGWGRGNWSWLRSMDGWE